MWVALMRGAISIGRLIGTDDGCFAKAIGATLAIGIGDADARGHEELDTPKYWHASTARRVPCLGVIDGIAAIP